MTSQNPLANLKRKQPRTRGTFPGEVYREQVLDPLQARAEEVLGDAALDIVRAHVVTLAEQRIVEPAVAAQALRSLDDLPDNVEALPHHPLAQLEARVVAASSAETLMGRSREETAVAAMRMALRDRLLDLAAAVLDLRQTLAELASTHLRTMMLATSNGQVVQPTTLAHYLAGQLGPLGRTSERLRESWDRVNRSPLGAISGMSTAMPIRRERPAELLGFDGLIESTFDAIASADILSELLGIVSIAAVELLRLASDLSQWARDDVGTLAPGDEFVHPHDVQPQRRDPLVLDHLRTQLAAQAGAPQQLAMMLMGRQMLGGEVNRYEAFFLVERQLSEAADALGLLASVLRSAEVNRSLFANRTNRGFATSSELADLLSIDFQLPRAEAVALAERIVVESTEAGGETTTLRTEFIDQIALRERGEEVGIEAELLARALAPKRFIERRDVIGGPAPGAVSDSLERETFSLRRERTWLTERRGAISAARERLHARAGEITRDPDGALSRRQAATQTGDSDPPDGKI